MGMENLIKAPLFAGSNLDVYWPDIDYFIQKINNKEYVSQMRFQIEYWNMIRSAMRLMGYPGKEIPINLTVDKGFLDKLSRYMIKAFNKDVSVSHRRPWKFSREVFRTHLEAITTSKPEGLILGVADRAIYYGDSTAPNGNKWQADLIKKLLPNGETPFVSTVWRKWAQSGEIQKFVDVIKNKPVVVVGPFYYKNLAHKIGLTNHRYIQIDLMEACLHVNKTMQQMSATYSEMVREHGEVIFIMSGGSAGAYLSYKFHDKFKKAHMFELGRALDVYFYYDKIRRQQPKWVFGEWMDSRPPIWIKEGKNVK